MTAVDEPSVRYQEEPCADAEEFVEKLFRPFPYARVEPVLYRGVGDLSWGLIPAALRAPWRQPSATEQMRMELDFLVRFAVFADRAGLHLPGVSTPTDVQHITQDRRRWGLGAQFPLPLIELAGLAQHHGVPTRLLDWTTDRRIAGWFAAVSAETLGARLHDAKIAVWALQRDSYAWHTFTALRGADGAGDEIVDHHLLRVDLARAPNARLHAQSGLFLMQQPCDPVGHFPATDPTGDEFAWFQSNTDMAALLHKPPVVLTVAASQAEKVRRLIERDDLTLERLKPDYDAAAVATIRSMYATGRVRNRGALNIVLSSAHSSKIRGLANQREVHVDRVVEELLERALREP